GIPEGGTVAGNNGTVFSVSYTGGDGNDIVLTVLSAAATPIFFNLFPQGIGVAASPSNMYGTGWCDQNLYGVDCKGNRSVLGMIPFANQPCIEKYLDIAPSQSVADGFSATDVFITEGANIWKYSGGTITFFAQIECSFPAHSLDHSSITFDKVGTFGFKMIVTCEQGLVFAI